MRYAIDRIKAGSEKEVHANEFSAMPIIPFRLSRFFALNVANKYIGERKVVRIPVSSIPIYLHVKSPCFDAQNMGFIDGLKHPSRVLFCITGS